MNLRRRLAALALAAVGLPALTALLVPSRDSVGLPTALLLYLLLAVVVAAIGGILPAAVVAFSAFLLANYYFTRPYDTLRVYDAEDYVGVVVFLLVAGIVSLLVDRVGELRAEAHRSAALAQVNELRKGLLAAVSHDLRTPLSTIKASVTSLLDPEVDWPPAEEHRFLASIASETDRLNRLIGNLLDAGRISADAVDALLTPVGLDEVVPVALSGLPGRQAVVVDVPETLPLVLADPALLERAIANVAENALRHSPADTQVRVEAEAVGEAVELRVIDAGPGIPRAERERVFRPFQRLGDSGGGAGLGLAIARGFVEAMNGALTLKGAPGGGTTVVIRLGRPT